MKEPEEADAQHAPADEQEPGRTSPPDEARRKFEWDRPQKIAATLAAVFAILTGIGGAVAWVASTRPPDPTVREVQPQPPAKPAATSPAAQQTHAAVPPGGSGWSTTEVNTRNDFLYVTASMNPLPSCQDGGAGWVFQQKPGELAPMRWAEQKAKADEWAHANSGIPRAGNHVQLTLGELNGAFVINSISARVTRRSAPSIQTVPELSTGCGGVTQSYFEVNLDEGDNPRATPVSAAGVAPVPLPHKLDAQDRFETWNVIVNTSSCDCDFVLAFTYTVAGQPHTYEVPLQDGKPWRVSAAPGLQPVPRDPNGAWSQTMTPPARSSTTPAR